MAGVALTVINVAQLGLDPATDAAEAADVTALGTDLTEEGATAAESTAPEEAAPAEEEPAPSCGGQSFTPATKVLLASGAAIPVSQLRPGQKVLATSTKTSKTQPETIAAVLVHHDTCLYDLTIRTHGRTAVIGTTSNHLFWDQGARRWVKAGALKYGTRLRTPAGAAATALGGYAPRDRSGWMWDLTIPGDHDFYVLAATTAVLVHNCPAPRGNSPAEQNGPRWMRGDRFAKTRQALGKVAVIVNLVHSYIAGNAGLQGPPSEYRTNVENPPGISGPPSDDWSEDPPPIELP